MRLPIALLALASLTVAPRGAYSQEERPAPPPRPGPSAPPPPAHPPAAPRPAPELRTAPPPRPEYSPYPRTGPRPGRPYYYQPAEPRPRYWSGWGWGWGWYPVYPYRAVPVPAPDQPIDGRLVPVPREQDRIYTRLSLYGAGREDGYMAGGSLGIEGRYVGFNVDIAALASEAVTGPLDEDGSDPATWTTTHLTWSLVNDRSVRLRLETGLSILDLPDSPATVDREWRGKTLLGPDLGVSGHIGLVGPVGIEGHARLTPFPTRVADTFVGLAVHGGPLGVSAGWRWVDVAGDDDDAPATMFRGPQVGLVLRF